jgi:GDP-L-fucose synthase
MKIETFRMKILITGSTGFIGRNLKDQLSIAYDIYAPESLELNLLDDKRVRDYVKKHNFDVIIHSATWNATRTSTKDLNKVLPNNCRMFFNLARCDDYYGKMIYYGSGAEYDRRNWIPMMNEDYFDLHVPEDDYGFSKYIMSKHTEKSLNIYDLRLFGVFGKYEDWRIRFISNACCKSIMDMPITIKQNVYFDYLYINDLVNITEWFIKNEPQYKCYNICTGRTYDLLTLAEKILNISGKNLPINIAKKGLGREYSGDNKRFLDEIGAYSFIDIDDSIRELNQWYLSNKASIEKNRFLNDQ